MGGAPFGLFSLDIQTVRYGAEIREGEDNLNDAPDNHAAIQHAHITTVVGIVPVIAHDKVLASRHLSFWKIGAMAHAILVIDIGFFVLFAIHIDVAIDHSDLVSGNPDDAFDEVC